MALYWSAPHFTVIPDKLYSDADKEQYLLPLKAPSTFPEKYLADAIPSIHSKLIYTIPSDLQELLTQSFVRNVSISHSFTSIIKEFSKQASRGKELFLNVRDYWLQLFFFDNKELIFVNQFPFQSEKDFLYYVLLAYDQFKLDPKEVPLKVTGMLSKDSAIFKQIDRYIKEVSFVGLPTAFSADLDLKEFPDHLFFDILHAA